MSDYPHHRPSEFLSACETLVLFREGELSPVEFMRTTLDRCASINKHINAVAYLFPDEALREAKNSEQRYLRGEAYALDGLPTAIKDETGIAGQPAPNGSLLWRDRVSTSTDPVPQRLRRDGAIVHMRATAPEGSCGAVTWSHLWGVTRNPWNLDITPGGSSGGCAAAVAAGMASLANATDSGGSIRIPAALCGVVGVKASFGRIPEIPPYNNDPYCHHGYLTRTIEDAALLYPRLAGAHELDPSSQLACKPLPEQFASIAGLRIAWSEDLGFYPVQEDITAALRKAVAHLRDAGAQLEAVSLDWDERVIFTARAHQYRGVRATLSREQFDQMKRHKLTPYYRRFLHNALFVPERDLAQADAYRLHMQRSLERLFAEFDALICPTVASTRIPANFDSTQDEVHILGQRVDPVKGWFMTYPFNTLSRHPVISMPIGLAENNVPIGAQVVAPGEDEPMCFRVASALGALVPKVPPHALTE